MIKIVTLIEKMFKFRFLVKVKICIGFDKNQPQLILRLQNLYESLIRIRSRLVIQMTEFIERIIETKNK